MGQNPNDLFVKDTVAEEIAYTLDALGITGERHDSLTAQIVAELDLEALLDATRAICRAANVRGSHSPPPSAETPRCRPRRAHEGYGRAAQGGARGDVRRWAGAGRCVVLVTHDVEFAASVVDRVIVLGDRGLLADGPAADVLDGSLFFSTQINRLFRRVLPGVLREDEIEWGEGAS